MKKLTKLSLVTSVIVFSSNKNTYRDFAGDVGYPKNLKSITKNKKKQKRGSYG